MPRTKTTGAAPAKRARKTKPPLTEKPVKTTEIIPSEPKRNPDPFTFVTSYDIGNDIVEEVYALYIGGEGSFIRTVHNVAGKVIDVDVIFVQNVQAIDGQLRRKLK